MSKYEEAAVFWRFANNHDPDGWSQLGTKATQEINALREMVAPEDHEAGQSWRGGDSNGKDEIEFKIMQRTVTVSDWVPER